MREDHLASSGAPGLGGFGESSLTPGEAQARGFEHGHDKKTSIPKSHVIQQTLLKRACEMQRHDDPNDLMTTYNQQLIAYATTRQYESSVLPGRQLGIQLPASPFSALQQRQSKYDGQLEVDETTTRDLVEIIEHEPAAHVAREQRQASAEHRCPLNAYSQVQLTGNSLTLQPAYQLAQNFDEDYAIIDRGEMHPLGVHSQRPRMKLWDVCCFDEAGNFKHFMCAQDVVATPADFRMEASKWEQAFAHDYRWLSGHNHDHTCSTTCVKKLKKASTEEKAKAVKSSRVPPCRFWFLHVVVLYVTVGLETVCKKIRRRGKSVLTEPTIANTNEHNEYGLVEPERPQPFRSPSSDVACTGDRCNDDFRIMARGFPEGGEIEKHVRCDARSLARCFPDVAYRDVASPLVRRMAYSVVALHVAAHNCDFSTAVRPVRRP